MDSPPQPGIHIRDMVKVFTDDQQGEVRALDNVSLHIRSNEFFTLLGPSGCGKTTLLRVIAGFEQPSQGRVLLDDLDVTDQAPYRRPVNTVFQSYALFPHMTVAENVRFGLEMQKVDPAAAERRVAEMLELVHLTGMERRKTGQLSGGQQQRVALARALAPAPKVLLLDEPLSALDFKLRKGMQIELKRLQQETGITFVFVTHDQEEALTMSDRVAVMKSGKVLQIGTPEEIYRHPVERFVADFIGETNFLPATLSTEGHPAVFTVGNAGGFTVRAEASQLDQRQGSQVTLAVRPERTFLDPAGHGEGLSGRVETVVYFGTDTLYHVRVDGLEAPLTARIQNRDNHAPDIDEGAEVRITFPDDAVQVLKD
ncbi:ABC transporter ATP-binding protein [Roseospirillum parvum]|uniref:Spermidine/putrescine import ATP-binding protein PotA n=1 Tax=Roseospirillum parvum TaxID=83401 RepID=A0A1G7TNX9_9PROT|nr:ABC transporter ATP-binding protein [Roseospirillum parvum]SDG36724.1 spermidine/putrescine transport system ATP-binding protein [Roseospirillum parvum]